MWTFIAQILLEDRLKALNIYLCQMVLCSLSLSSLCSFFHRNFNFKISVIFVYIRRERIPYLMGEEKDILCV